MTTYTGSKDVTEEQWTDTVASLAVLEGWTTHRNEGGSNSGWPRLTLVSAGRLIFVWTRKDGSDLTKGQQAVWDVLAEVCNGAGGVVRLAVWTPSQLADVLAVLSCDETEC